MFVSFFPMLTNATKVTTTTTDFDFDPDSDFDETNQSNGSVFGNIWLSVCSGSD